MLVGYATMDGLEVVNHARLQAYVDAGFGGSFESIDICGCPALTPEALGAAYVSPAADPAPWYDANVPASGEFAGLWVLSMTGHDERPTSRTVSQAVTGGGVFSRQRIVPRTIVVQGVLLGSSCCGVAYGLRWLGQALDGCGEPGCDGTTLGALDCCPPEPAPDILDTHGRSMRRVALVSGPSVTRRAGDGCEGGCTADVLFVEFVLSAAEPWLWTPPTEVASEPIPTDDGSACIDWVLSDGPCTPLAACPHGTNCSDPSCMAASPPEVSGAGSCFCRPIATNRSCVEVDTTAFGSFTDLLPIITVEAGSSDLRRFTVSIFTKDDPTAACCEGESQDIDYDEATVDYSDPDVYYDGLHPSIADLEACDPHSVYHVGYLQAGGTMTLDGQVRKASVTCDDEVVPAADVWGADGAPLTFTPLGCGQTYCIILEADGLFTPAADAVVTIELSARA